MPGMQGTGAMPVTSGGVPGRAWPSPVSGGSCSYRLDSPGRAARLGTCRSVGGLRRRLALAITSAAQQMAGDCPVVGWAGVVAGFP